MKVLICLPSHDGRGQQGVLVPSYAQAPGGVQVDNVQITGSLLANNFNRGLCLALNQGYQFFGLLHDDIDPGRGWLGALFAALLDHGADLVAGVVPLKTGGGLTSTAEDAGGEANRWRVSGYLRADDLADLPAVFSVSRHGFSPVGDDAGGRRTLLVNSGCVLADLRKAIWRRTNDAGELSAYFTINDRIVRQADGQYVAEVESEDYFLSRRLAALGALVLAVQLPRLVHYGRVGFQIAQEARGDAE